MSYELFAHPEKKKNIYLVDMTREHGYFSEMLTKGIRKYIKEGKKILLIVNKKGFASWLLCTHCWHIPQCDNCSVSIAYHLQKPKEHDSSLHISWICHICKKVYELPKNCPQCHQSDTLKLYGLTIEKTEQRIQQEFGIDPLIIQSEWVSSLPKIERILAQGQDAQIILGTSIAQRTENTTKPFDLVAVLSADQSLSLPDYSVRQDTFVQLYNLISTTHAGTVLMQSYDTTHDSIRYACKLDRDWFMEREGSFRKQHHYPPYGELCVIKYKNENEATLHNTIQALHKELLYLQKTYQYNDLLIYSAPPLVYKKFGKFYYHIIVLWPQGKVRPFMDICFSKLMMRKRGFKIDWMADRIT